MKLHVFNPEHDLAMGCDEVHFIAPHHVMALRSDLDYIPAIWADDGDAVLVDDAKRADRMCVELGCPVADVHFVTCGELRALPVDEICPWGWDSAVCWQLKKYGTDDRLLPSRERLEQIRRLSNRRLSLQLLSALRARFHDGTCGDAAYCTSAEELLSVVHDWGDIIVKAPWSSSGRGIRRLNSGACPGVMDWCANVMHKQGGVMAEPYYAHREMDLAMEFFSDGNGRIDYRGLSVFHTLNSSYASNLLATESRKASLLCQFVPALLAEKIKSEICKCFSPLLRNIYKGPFGVDMMIVKDIRSGKILLHPCVEVNLRMTMGHVALALSPADDGPLRSMSIVRDSSFALHISAADSEQYAARKH